MKDTPSSFISLQFPVERRTDSAFGQMVNARVELYQAHQATQRQDPTTPPVISDPRVAEAIINLLDSGALSLFVQPKHALQKSTPSNLNDSPPMRAYEVLARVDDSLFKRHPEYLHLMEFLELGAQAQLANFLDLNQNKKDPSVQKATSLTDKADLAFKEGLAPSALTAHVRSTLPASKLSLNIADLSYLAQANDLGPYVDFKILFSSIDALARMPVEQRSQTRFNVNMLPSTISMDNFSQRLIDRCRDKGVDPKHLCVEILESEDIADIDALARNCSALRRAGCKVALDDFCTGYASPDVLLKVDVDEVKIPRNFVLMLDEPELKQKALFWIRGMVSHAKALGATVTIEGAETQAHVDLFQKMGIDQAQGYYWERPHPIHDLFTQQAKSTPIDPNKPVIICDNQEISIPLGGQNSAQSRDDNEGALLSNRISWEPKEGGTLDFQSWRRQKLQIDALALNPDTSVSEAASKSVSHKKII